MSGLFEDERELHANQAYHSSSPETRAEAVAEREKELEYRKNQSGNIYSFELTWEPAKGEETSKPKLIYRDKEQPNYGAAK